MTEDNFSELELEFPQPASDFFSWLSGPGAILHDALDHHAAALESLSMTPATPSFANQAFTIPNWGPMSLTPTNLHEIELEVVTSSEDYYLGIQNKDQFADITVFFRRAFTNLEDTAAIGLECPTRPAVIAREDLRGDACDFQGIDWTLRRITRAAVREKRVSFEAARMPARIRTLREKLKNLAPISRADDFFSFRGMNTQVHAVIPHFQLRNLIACTSRNDIFYSIRGQVMRTDPTGIPTTIMDLSKEVSDGHKFQITTLAAADNVLIAGGFEGEYALTNLQSTYDTKYTLGRVTDRTQSSKSHITNHLHIFNSRSGYTPQAAFCSNDEWLRILDPNTSTFTHSFQYSDAVNCSATSPNGRMRVVVGDFHETLITNAETGKPFETLSAHTDSNFACAWADDGVHVATASQDGSIVIYDARSWADPLTVLHSELAIPRCLRFSPVGSGPRVLVAAEADDYVSIINAQTWHSRQVFDSFGPIAGITMTPDGQSLFVANSGQDYGGLMEFERCGWGEEGVVRGGKDVDNDDENDECEHAVDWESEDEMDEDGRVLVSRLDRRRRGMGLGGLVV
ncbi:WD40 repeat-like protein [Lojkania enalia]|uniref:WD40 repeat-like protein n=1 Tax=Lojkania enalia TaxID=147567 RepID=A0A9P4KH33_9PLEO|nr:WD40 repeat-like protein [Didymosphaeria enalia]